MKSDQKSLNIKWRRLVLKDQTCPRCSQTGNKLEKAISVFKTLEIKVTFEKKEIQFGKFTKDSLSSNQILINGHLLEYWVKGKTSHSKCCGVCGSNECRSINVTGTKYETVPALLIVFAGLIAYNAKLNIIHYVTWIDNKPHYTCNQAVNGDVNKMELDPHLVTCRNCLRTLKSEHK